MPMRPSTHRPRRRGRLIEELRRAIDCLPTTTREAMLEGIARNERIIVGAYVDGEGGVCPMLAAHRCGGRTDLLSFARAWDRFTEAGRDSRRASERELGVLVAHLQASLLQEAAPELDRAISEHRGLLARHRRAREADPSGEIRARRLRRPRRPYRASPGRTNIISGMTHAGESRNR
jgi:hypothetical protein